MNTSARSVLQESKQFVRWHISEDNLLNMNFIDTVFKSTTLRQLL